MTELERRTITIGRDDQRAVVWGRLRQTRGPLILIGLALALVLLLVATALTIARPTVDGWSFLIGVAVAVVAVVALLVGNQVVLTRRQLPLGAQFTLQVTDETLDLDGPGGSDRIRWRQLSNLRRVGGGVYLTITPSNAQLGLPGRLVSEAAFARAAEQIGRNDETDAVDQALAASAPTSGTLSSSITFTVEDQRVVRAALLRGSRTMLAIVGGFALIAIACTAIGAAGRQPSRLLDIAAISGAIALLLLIVLVITVHRTVVRSLDVGTTQGLALTPEGLELTGPGGETRFAWNQLADLRRRRGVVTVKAVSSKTTLAFVGRLVDDAMYASIAQRMDASRAAAR